MQLDGLYGRVSEAVTSLDFQSLWRGFEPLKFALFTVISSSKRRTKQPLPPFTGCDDRRTQP